MTWFEWITERRHPRNPGRQGAGRCAGHGQGLGAHKAQLEGRDFVRASVGRVVFPSAAGRRAEHIAELRKRGAAPDRRRCGRGDRHDRAVAGQGAAVRDAGERDKGGRLGRRPRHLPDPAEAAHARIPARGRASAAAHQRDRRRDTGAAQSGAGDPPVFRRERVFLGQHADHHRLRRRGGGGAVPGLGAGFRQSAAHAVGRGSISRRISSGARRF